MFVRVSAAVAATAGIAAIASSALAIGCFNPEPPTSEVSDTTKAICAQHEALDEKGHVTSIGYVQMPGETGPSEVILEDIAPATFSAVYSTWVLMYYIEAVPEDADSMMAARYGVWSTLGHLCRELLG